MIKVPNTKLNDGHAIPLVGLGLWQIKDESEFKTALDYAIKLGYRHFDTAQFYGNEDLLGQALHHYSLKRSDTFITTKINLTNFTPERLQHSFRESLERLQTDYVDLLLLHFPVPVLRKKAWLELEKIKSDGLAKSIGVSNYTTKHLDELFSYASVKPAINQVELHVFLQQQELRQYCQDNDIQVEAYSPLAHAHILSNPIIEEIAVKYHVSYAQVMLRWLIDQGLVIIPKSSHPKRLAENIDLFDFKLDKDDLNKIAQLDEDKHFLWSPQRIP